VADGIEFRSGELTAWVGYNGHRKGMFTSQVALDLAVQDQRILIVSLEMDPADTLARMVRQASGVECPNDRMIDKFHEWTDGRIWLFDHVGNLSVDKAFALCRYFADQHKGTHVFLDSMMMICASEEKLDEQKRFPPGWSGSRRRLGYTSMSSHIAVNLPLVTKASCHHGTKSGDRARLAIRLTTSWLFG